MSTSDDHPYRGDAPAEPPPGQGPPVYGQPGYGPPPESGDQALAGQVWVLAAIGAALAVAGGLLRFRAGGSNG